MPAVVTYQGTAVSVLLLLSCSCRSPLGKLLQEFPY